MKQFLFLALMFGLASCGEQQGANSKDVVAVKKDGAEASAVSQEKALLTVYKTPTCGCCGEWVAHVEESGFQAEVINKPTLADVKTKLGIPENARSCHTAISKQGYVFEGHVASKFITQFLAAPPLGARGLIVPAMPLGSPGMEYQNQFNPYQIFLLTDAHELELYASVNTYEEQF